MVWSSLWLLLPPLTPPPPPPRWRWLSPLRQWRHRPVVQQRLGGTTTTTNSSNSSRSRSSSRSNRVVRRFVSDFDGACAEYISNLLVRFPVVLKHTKAEGMGLFAARDIGLHEEVNFENPAFPMTQTIADKLEAAAEGLIVAATATATATTTTAAATPSFDMSSRSSTVAAMVDETIRSSQYPCRPSQYLPIRCLGSVPGQQHQTLEEAFLLIGKAYQLPNTLWTKEECQLLHDKAATNGIDEELYIATSMFNHSCDYNVIWSPSNPTRRLVAARPIRQGEQLFLSYSAQLADPIARHEYLWTTFGFRCTCSLCRQAGLVESDQ